MPSHLVGCSLAFTPMCCASDSANSTSKPVSLPRSFTFASRPSSAAKLLVTIPLVSVTATAPRSKRRRNVEKPIFTSFDSILVISNRAVNLPFTGGNASLLSSFHHQPHVSTAQKDYQEYNPLILVHKSISAAQTE